MFFILFEYTDYKNKCKATKKYYLIYLQVNKQLLLQYHPRTSL